MSDKRNPRREAARKPSLHAIHSWQEKNRMQNSTVTDEERREALSVIPEIIGPKAIEREINKAIHASE